MNLGVSRHDSHKNKTKRTCSVHTFMNLKLLDDLSLYPICNIIIDITVELLSYCRVTIQYISLLGNDLDRIGHLWLTRLAY